jgi:hypothetical protein
MSWWQLIAIRDEARRVAADEAATPPASCPRDGEPLTTHPVTGVLRCRFDGWEWDGYTPTHT